MKHSFKRFLCLGLCAVSAASLCACNTVQTESAFDNPRPWHDDVRIALDGSYERLEFDVKIYDTSAGIEEDKRITIADGNLSFTLEEPPIDGFTTLTTEFSVTYSQNAPTADKGLTDVIKSRVLFSTASFAVKEMNKTVKLATRDGSDNLSYTISADYFDAHTATVVFTDAVDKPEKTVKLPQDACRDNEMMFMLARAQKLETGTSNLFRMVNVFDSANAGKTKEYAMYCSSSTELKQMYIGDWVKDFGIEKSTEEITGAEAYPVPCYDTTIGINASRQGPPYRVAYSSVPFKSGEKSHFKIPVFISYSEYKNNSAYRCTEYTLSACSFDKQ